MWGRSDGPPASVPGRINDGGRPLVRSRLDHNASLRAEPRGLRTVEPPLLGGIDLEKDAPDRVRRLACEEDVGLPGAVAAPPVEAEGVIGEARDPHLPRGGDGLSQAGGAHVGAVNEAEHTPILRRGS